MLKVTIDGLRSELDMNGTVIDISRDMILAIRSVHAALKGKSDYKAEMFRKAVTVAVAREPLVWDTSMETVTEGQDAEGSG